MSINKMRSGLYGTARIMGDINAVAKGKIAQRIARRIVGRMTGRAMGRMFR